jgi:hypothetical protein
VNADENLFELISGNRGIKQCEIPALLLISKKRVENILKVLGYKILLSFLSDKSCQAERNDVRTRGTISENKRQSLSGVWSRIIKKFTTIPCAGKIMSIHF